MRKVYRLNFLVRKQLLQEDNPDLMVLACDALFVMQDLFAFLGS